MIMSYSWKEKIKLYPTFHDKNQGNILNILDMDRYMQDINKFRQIFLEIGIFL